MSVIRVAIPVLKAKRRFHLDKGRSWSVVEHLVLTALIGRDQTARAVADTAKLPRRVVIEALIRLMEARWIELSQRADGIVFSATETGKSVVQQDELPNYPKRIVRPMNFVTDLVTGTVYRTRELPPLEKHVLEERAQREPFVWVQPRQISTDHVRAVVSTLFDDDERFIAMDEFGDRQVDRFAVLTFRNGVVEGLPARAPKELEQIVRAAAETSKPAAGQVSDYVVPAAQDEAEPALPTPYSVVFKADDLILGADQHRELFGRLVKSCRHNLVIHSTFITEERFGTVMPLLMDAIKRGARIDVLWGKNDEDRGLIPETKKAVMRFRKEVSSLALDDVFKIHPLSTRSHSKIIVADTGNPDRHVAVVGSCNWLNSAIQSFEASVREVAPLSWTPDFLSFRSPQWQRSTALMRRSSAGR